jgi:hypothetical protein
MSTVAKEPRKADSSSSRLQFGTVFAKVTHAQGAKRGTVLTEGAITTRTCVDVAADVVGLSRAQIAEKQPAGTVRLQPIDRY